MIIDPAMLVTGIDLSAFFQMMDIITQGLLIFRKAVKRSVFNEFLLEEIINRGYAEIFSAVRFQNGNDGFLKRRNIKCLVFNKLFSRILRDDIHVIVLGYRRAAWGFQTLFLVIGQDLRFRIAAKF